VTCPSAAPFLVYRGHLPLCRQDAEVSSLGFAIAPHKQALPFSKSSLMSFEPKRRHHCHMSSVVWGFFIGAQYSLTAPFLFPAFTARNRAPTARRVYSGYRVVSLGMLW